MMGGGGGGLIGQIAPPIAAGGYLPMMPYPMNQQQQYSNGQQVTPGMPSPASNGSAQQAGGYPSPQQQAPQMPAYQAGLPSDAPQGMSRASMHQALMPQVQASWLDDVDNEQAAQTGATGAPDASSNSYTGKPLEAGTDKKTAPDQPISQSQDYIASQLDDLASRAEPEAAKAIKKLKDSLKKIHEEHGKPKETYKARRESSAEQVDNAMWDAHVGSTTAGATKATTDAFKSLYHTLGKAEKNSIRREIQRINERGSVHPNLRMAANIAEIGLGATRLGKGMVAFDKMIQGGKDKQQAHDWDVYKSFLDLMAATHGETSNRDMIKEERAAEKDDREAAKDYIVEPEKLRLEGLKAKAGVLDKQSNAINRGEISAERPLKLALERQNANAHTLSASTGASAFQLQNLKNQQAQAKNDMEKQKLQQQIDDAQINPYLPKESIGYRDYGNNLLQLLDMKVITGDQLNKIMGRAVSQGHILGLPKKLSGAK
jgi:hypothetical protein